MNKDNDFNEKKYYRNQSILGLICAVLELLGGVALNSTMLLADGLHWLADSLNGIVSFLVAHFVQKNGRSKEDCIRKRGSNISIALLIAVVCLVIHDGMKHVIYPEKVDDRVIWVALLGLVVNLIQRYFHQRVPREHHHTITYRLYKLDLDSDILTSLGVVAGSILMRFSDKLDRIDGFFAVVIGLSITWSLCKQLKGGGGGHVH